MAPWGEDNAISRDFFPLPLTPYDLRLTVFFDLNGIFCYDALNFCIFPYDLFSGIGIRVAIRNWGEHECGVIS